MTFQSLVTFHAALLLLLHAIRICGIVLRAYAHHHVRCKHMRCRWQQGQRTGSVAGAGGGVGVCVALLQPALGLAGVAALLALGVVGLAVKHADVGQSCRCARKSSSSPLSDTGLKCC